MSFLPTIIQFFHEANSPEYVKNKENAKRDMQAAELTANAILVVAAVSTVFGFALVVTGGIAAVLGLSIIFVNLPLTFFSFNTYKISENIIDIIVDNPKKYLPGYRLRENPEGDGLIGNTNADLQVIRKKLLEGTCCFGGFVDHFLYHKR